MAHAPNTTMSMASQITNTAGVELPVALTFDLDPDHFDPSMGEGYGSDALQWQGVEHGVPAIAEILSDFRDDFGNRASATWLPRVDNQIGGIYGDYGAILDRFDGLLQQLAEAGDEIAWHPHLHRRDAGAWVQETDPERLAEILHTALDALHLRGWRPRATRMGGNYGSNALMGLLEEIGIEVDSSAMPGRQRNDNHYELDWSDTPPEAFSPALSDYRIPGEPAYALVELPLSMAKVRADYDSQPYARYVDLSFHPRALQPGLTPLVKQATAIVTDTHPSTVLPGVASSAHGLLSYSLEDFQTNLVSILETCARHERPVRFVTLSDPRLRPASSGSIA